MYFTIVCKNNFDSKKSRFLVSLFLKKYDPALILLLLFLFYPQQILRLDGYVFRKRLK